MFSVMCALSLPLEDASGSLNAPRRGCQPNHNRVLRYGPHGLAADLAYAASKIFAIGSYARDAMNESGGEKSMRV